MYDVYIRHIDFILIFELTLINLITADLRNPVINEIETAIQLLRERPPVLLQGHFLRSQ